MNKLTELLNQYSFPWHSTFYGCFTDDNDQYIDNKTVCEITNLLYERVNQLEETLQYVRTISEGRLKRIEVLEKGIIELKKQNLDLAAKLPEERWCPHIKKVMGVWMYNSGNESISAQGWESCPVAKCKITNPDLL